jgi:DNA-directed RNA polymerase specialized sigma24 family protein
VVEDEERYVRARGNYLERSEGLPEKYGRMLGWSELGYSSSGIAKKMDVAQGTVRSWMDRIEEKYGTAALFPRPNSEALEELE